MVPEKRIRRNTFIWRQTSSPGVDGKYGQIYNTEGYVDPHSTTNIVLRF